MGRSESWDVRAARIPRRRLLARTGLGAIGIVAGAACASNPPAPKAAPGGAANAGSPPGAGSSSGAAAAAAPAAAQPKYGGRIQTTALALASHRDPHQANGIGLGIDPLICYSKLVTYQWGKDIKAPSYLPGPDLAESWSQADETTYLFKLRSGVKWHNLAPVNGRELVADDVLYSYQRIRDLKFFAAPLAGIARIEAPDRTTVKLTLDKPNADLAGNLCDVYQVIVAKEVVDANGDLKTAPVIGTGPWIFENMDGQSFSAKRNPDRFVKGRPYVDGFEFAKAGEVSAILNAFRAGNVNVIGTSLNPQGGEELLRTAPKAKVFWVPLDRSPNHLVINPSREPFGDIRLRQAVAKAIDRKAIIDTVQLGHAVLTSGLPLPGTDWSLPADELDRSFARDVDGAKRLLREAGKESGFDMEMIVPPYVSGTLITMSELIQANLKDVGIRATIRQMDGPAWGAVYNNGDFQTSMTTSSFPAPNATLYSRYYTGGAQNKIGYTNPALDKLIDQQAVLGRDPDTRKKLLLDTQRAILTDAVYIPLHAFQQPTFYADNMRDLYPPGGIFGAGDFWSTVWFDQ
jgi:ABC-type transport system substrate-binding protein